MIHLFPNLENMLLQALLLGLCSVAWLLLLLLREIFGRCMKCQIYDHRHHQCKKRLTNRIYDFCNPSTHNHLDYIRLHQVCLASNFQKSMVHHYAPKSSLKTRSNYFKSLDISDKINPKTIPNNVQEFIINNFTYYDSCAISAAPIHHCIVPTNSQYLNGRR